MKKLVINALVIVAGGAALLGCKKYLDTVPDNRVDLSDPANITVENVSQLLVNAYPKANYMAFCEAMSDNAAEKEGGNLATANYYPYIYADVNNSHGQDMPTTYWDESYKAIALTNQALAAIGKVTNPGKFAAQRGEALVARAYAHFMLVNLFSKTYDPATANGDMGVPYVTSPETVVYAQYDRKTVSYVYEAIEKDLLEGLPLLNDGAYSVPKYHFNIAAANAFAARFYLFYKKYDKVITYASKVSSGGNFAVNMRPWLTTYRLLPYFDLQMQYTKPAEKANLLLVEAISNYANSFPYYRYGLTSNQMKQMFDSTGTTAKLAHGKMGYAVYGSAQSIHIPKFYPHFVQGGLNAQTGYYYNTLPLLTVEEALLNRAEAYANLGNYGAALADLNTFASQRIYNGFDKTGNIILYNPAINEMTQAAINTNYHTTDNKTGIISAILDFKRAEFVFEGMRWFDILRHKIEVKHAFKIDRTIDNISVQKDTAITLTANDPRRQLQLPDAAMTAGLPLNPRDK